MNNPVELVKLLRTIADRATDSKPKLATAMSVEGTTVTIQLKGSPSLIRGVKVLGNPDGIRNGDEIAIVWDTDKNGYPVPVAIAPNSSWQVASEEGVSDHGELSGLSDDDHPQYAALAQNESVTGQWQFAPAATQAPFTLNANAQGQLVTGLNADKLDGYEASELIGGASAPPDGQYLTLNLDDDLTAERVLTPGNGIAGTDGGAGSTYTLAVDLAATSGLEFSTGKLQINDTIAGNGLTIASKVLAINLGSPSGLAISGDALSLDDNIAGNGLSISSKVLSVGAGSGITVNANTVDLTTPGTLTVSTSNSASGNHTHAITASDAPSGASLLKSSASGYLQLVRLGLGVTPSYPLHVSGNAYMAGVVNETFTINQDDTSATSKLIFMHPTSDGEIWWTGSQMQFKNPSQFAQAVIFDNSVTFNGAINFTGTSSDTFTINNDDTNTTSKLIFMHPSNDGEIWWTGSQFQFKDPVAFESDLSFGHILPVATDTYDIGSSSLIWRKAYISEMEAVLFSQNSVNVQGGWLMIPHSAGTIGTDVTAVATRIDFGDNAGSISANDFILLRSSSKVEYVRATSLYSGTTWNVTRNLDGSGADTWPSGQVWVNLGYNGDGRIELNSQSGGSKIQVLVQGTSYNSQTEYVRIGDLTSWQAAGLTGYGYAVGNYSANEYAYYSPSTGMVIRGSIYADDGQLASLSVSGTLTMGTGGVLKSGATAYNSGTGFWLEYNAGTPRLFIGNSSANKLTWDGTNISVTGTITATGGNILGTLDIGTSGVLKSGATAYDSGTGFWLEYNSGTPRLFIGNSSGNKLTWSGTNISVTGTIYATGGQISGNLQIVSGGKIYVGTNGETTLDSSGLRFYNATSEASTNYVSWYNGTPGNNIGKFGIHQQAGGVQMQVLATGPLSAQSSNIVLAAQAMYTGSGNYASVNAYALDNSLSSNYVQISTGLYGSTQYAWTFKDNQLYMGGSLAVGYSSKQTLSNGTIKASGSIIANDDLQSIDDTIVGGDLQVTGTTQVYRGGAYRTGYLYVPITQLAPAAWNNVSPPSSQYITLTSSPWSLPSGLKAVNVQLIADPGANSGSVAIKDPNGENMIYMSTAEEMAVNGPINRRIAIVEVDSSGRIYWESSGLSDGKIYVRIHGYFI